MSKIREMIDRMCPEGVAFRYLKDISDIKTGKGITQKDCSDDAPYPVISGGQTPMGMYNSYNREADTVTISRVGAYAGYVNYMTKRFYLNDKCFSVIPNKSISLDNKFLYYCLKLKEEDIKGLQSEGGVPTINTQKVGSLEIPVPPIEVQREIVKVLDSFSELDGILNAELAARKKQFLWVQQQCFSNKTFMFGGRLEDCCVLVKGATPIQKAIPGEYPLVVTTATRRTSSTYQFTEPSVCIPLVSSRGHGVASLNSVYYQEGKFALGNILCGVTPKDQKDLNAKYLYYYLNYKKDSLIVPLMKGGANVSLTVDALKKVVVSYPSIEEQCRVVSMLEPFEAFFDVEKGLPAEIKARQQQYESYRDQLLTFKRAN